MILTIRTDKPEAEIGLYDGQQQVAYVTWAAHRELGETIHHQIAKLLQKQKKDWNSIEGIVCYKGPGSFTGLRIGLSVANSLAYSIACSIVAEGRNDWIKHGVSRLANEESDQLAIPEYGALPNTTSPRK